MDGRASPRGRAVNDGNALAGLCRGNSALLARWATADCHKVVLWGVHFENT
jgi:hypothetical protein